MGGATGAIMRAAAVTLLCTAVALAATPEERAAALVSEMTIEEKITMLHGISSPHYTGLTAPIPRLNIPSLTPNDGRQGFRPNDRNTGQSAFPCEINQVATFDVALMHEFGRAMGDEFVRKGSNVVLAPMLILARVPQDGRIFESIGEDPELAHDMAFAMISGVQSNVGVIANADDFVLNNQELDRGDVSSVCDRRTLFEGYYRGYAGAIEANVGSFMCSYNRINGTHACENPVTLGDLKNPSGLNFSGWVLSDWGGVHSTVPSALAGLDQEMPGGEFFGPALLAAVVAGNVSEALVNDKVLRVLTPMFRAGIMDTPNTGTEDTNVTTPEHNALARTLAAAGTVLLSNQGMLPLSAAVKSITVVGSAAQDSPYCCGAGSGALDPPYLITPLAGIIARAGPSVNVTYLRTPPVFLNVTQWFSRGRGDHFLDFVCDECPSPPDPDAYVPLRSEGFLSSGECPPALGCVELDLWYDPLHSSNLIIASGMTPPTPGYAKVRPLGWALPLNYSGVPTAILELWQGHDTPTGAPPLSHLDYVTLASDATRAEVQAAGYTRVATMGRLPLAPLSPPEPPAAGDVVIVVVSTPSSEGSDRKDLSLSAADDAMIAALVSNNPKVVVVINNPGAVVMPWADDAGAILAAWYPGQEMGNALADILWGDVNPSGRTPITFPMSNADTPLQTPEQYPGVCPPDGGPCVVTYSERLLFGYRYWDAMGIEPLFAFGHGLSYTSFTYSALTIDTASTAPNVLVSCIVTNSGSRAGKEIPQLYIAFPASAGEPPQVLRGFRALLLSPGEAQTVTFSLAPRDLSTWDVDAYSWALARGTFGVSVGASSRDIRLRNTFVM